MTPSLIGEPLKVFFKFLRHESLGYWCIISVLFDQRLYNLYDHLYGTGF